MNQRGALVTTKIAVAEPKAFIYVSHATKNTNVDDIKEYIRDMKEEFLHVELLKQTREVDFNSFKITIIVSKLNSFLNKDFWPQGIVFRRYRQKIYNKIAAKRNKTATINIYNG